MIQNNRNLISILLSLCHIFLLTLSNVLVQYPFQWFGFHTTWGAFTYPAIFILTDLTVRLSSSRYARRIILLSMLPGLLISYVVASYIETSPSGDFWVIHPLPLRVAFACFVAYVVGQLLDIFIFQYYRKQKSWWVAPLLSTTIGNFVDTALFFFVAFYHSTHPFLSQHWMEIAEIDFFFKITISFIAFIPAYGVMLRVVNGAWERRGMSPAFAGDDKIE